MMRLLAIFLLLLPSLALGQSGEPSLVALQKRWSLLEGHRGRLEQLLSAQVRRIGRLKAQRPGVRRDYQLESALRENQKLAAKLTHLQERIRELNAKLVASYDRTIRDTPDPAERKRLKQRRDRIARQQRDARATTIVTREKASPLDSAEDLEEKADLLKDSEEKVRRQLRRLKQQIDRLKHRARLKKHSRAVDDSPFVEESPRRLARAKASASTAKAAAAEADDRNDAPQGTADPAPPSTDFNSAALPAPGGGKVTGDASGESTAGTPPPAAPSGTTSDPGGSLSLSIRGVMDPGTLRELQRAARSGSLKDRIAAMEKARRRLEQMARKLGDQARHLRKKAKSVR